MKTRSQMKAPKQSLKQPPEPAPKQTPKPAQEPKLDQNRVIEDFIGMIRKKSAEEGARQSKSICKKRRTKPGPKNVKPKPEEKASNFSALTRKRLLGASGLLWAVRILQELEQSKKPVADAQSEAAKAIRKPRNGRRK